MRVLVLVPAWNEERSIGAVVREVTAVEGADLLVIDDGSEDETAVRAEEAGARVLRLPFNLGIGGAMQAGYLFAMRHDYDVAVQVDGDGQHDAREIPKLLAPITCGEADLVLGSRYVGSAEYRAPAARRLGMQLFSATVSVLTGQELLDTTSGFRAAGKAAIAYLAEHYPRDYPEVEALVLLKRAGFRVRELGCRFRMRSEGRSSITPVRSVYYVIKVLLAIGVGLFREVPPREGSIRP